MARILAAACGILFISFVPSLPPLQLACALLIIPLAAVVLSVVPLASFPSPMLAALSSLRCLFFAPVCGIAGAFALGAGWGILAGYHLLDQQLATEWEGRRFQVTGTIVGLPHMNPRRHRFELEVHSFAALEETRDEGYSYPGKLRLSWYYGPELLPGEVWQLEVTLRRPRGFVNPGGFDYQAWLLQRGIGATGYVRKSSRNQRLRAAPEHSLSLWRRHIQMQVDNTPGLRFGAILKALAIGDRGGLSVEQWGLLQRTGTNHLMAISGLHIGLLASLGFGLGAFVGRLILLINPYSGQIRYTGAFGAITLAALYSGLAGFSLPTQRALVMVGLLNLALINLKPVFSLHIWACALLCVLIASPLAGHNLGFWLSFAAVGILLMVFVGRSSASTSSSRAWVRQIAWSQWAIFAGLLLPLLALGLTAAPVAPMANVIAIPLVSWAVVPPLLAGICLLDVFPAAGWLLITVADKAVGWTLSYLSWCDRLPLSPWWPATELSAGVLATAGFGVLLLLTPRGLPGRWLGAVCLGVLLWPAVSPAPLLRLTVLDVGQGLAVVVETPAHTLVYDTGPEYSQSFNAGSGILAPYLRSRGVRHIDRIVVSHADNDHSGGFTGLTTTMTANHVLWAEALTGDLMPVKADYCRAGQFWEWEGVEFRVLWPVSGSGAGGGMPRNDHSCVIMVSLGAQRILLPGDIEEAAEAHLLRGEHLPAGIRVLIAPHHGSITSSTAGFVRRLRPEYVVYSAGFGNRYGHPHPKVVKRYRQVGARAANTAYTGAITFTWNREGRLEVQYHRQTSQRYWFTELTH